MQCVCGVCQLVLLALACFGGKATTLKSATMISSTGTDDMDIKSEAAHVVHKHKLFMRREEAPTTRGIDYDKQKARNEGGDYDGASVLVSAEAKPTTTEQTTIQQPPMRHESMVKDNVNKLDASAPLDLMDIAERNERTRNSVNTWISSSTLKASVNNYGLEQSSPSLVDMVGKPKEGDAPAKKDKKSPTKDDFVSQLGKLKEGDAPAKKGKKSPSKDDFVSQLGSRLSMLFSPNGKHVNYLDIGASTLESMHIQAQILNGGVMTAWDLEDPNPDIEKLWRNEPQVDSWPASPYRRQHGRTHDFINRYHDKNYNIMYYLAGDIFNKTSHSKLKRHVVGNYGDFNLISSNAQNTSEGVENEIDILISNKFIKPGRAFAMVWDDCLGVGPHPGTGIYDGVLHTAFPKLQALFGKSCMGSLEISGHQKGLPHGLCVFSTLDLSGPRLGASKTWSPGKHNITCTTKKIIDDL